MHNIGIAPHEDTEGEPPRNPHTVFLLGAGASVAAGIPAVRKMTQDLVSSLKSKDADLSRALDTLIQQLTSTAAGSTEPDIEDILQILNQLIEYPRNPISRFTKADHNLPLPLIEKLKGEIELHIRNAVIAANEIGYLRPLLSDTWGSATHIFSLNYDTCIELLCRKHQRRLIDGFTPEWTPQALTVTDSALADKALFLYKLHGSVLWYRSTSGWYVKMPLGPLQGINTVPLYDGETATPVLLYPMFKQPQESPLLDFAYILKQYLESARHIVSIGYSFRDDYINVLLRDALNNNPKLHLTMIAPDAQQSYSKIIGRTDLSFQRAFKNRTTCLPFAAERFLEKFRDDYIGYTAAIASWNNCRSYESTGAHPQWESTAVDTSRRWILNLSIDAFSKVEGQNSFKFDELLQAAITNYALALALDDPEMVAASKRFLNFMALECWRLISFRYSAMGDNVRIHFALTNANSQISASSIERASDEALKAITLIATYMLSAKVPLPEFTALKTKVKAAGDFYSALMRQDHRSKSEALRMIPNSDAFSTRIAEDIRGKDSLHTPLIPPARLVDVLGLPRPEFTRY